MTLAQPCVAWCASNVGRGIRRRSRDWLGCPAPDSATIHTSGFIRVVALGLYAPGHPVLRGRLTSRHVALDAGCANWVLSGLLVTWSHAERRWPMPWASSETGIASRDRRDVCLDSWRHHPAATLSGGDGTALTPRHTWRSPVGTARPSRSNPSAIRGAWGFNRGASIACTLSERCAAARDQVQSSHTQGVTRLARHPRLRPTLRTDACRTLQARAFEPSPEDG